MSQTEQGQVIGTIHTKSRVNIHDFKGIITRPVCVSCHGCIFQETEKLVALEGGGYAHKTCADKEGW